MHKEELAKSLGFSVLRINSKDGKLQIFKNLILFFHQFNLTFDLDKIPKRYKFFRKALREINDKTHITNISSIG